MSSAGYRPAAYASPAASSRMGSLAPEQYPFHRLPDTIAQQYMQLQPPTVAGSASPTGGYPNYRFISPYDGTAGYSPPCICPDRHSSRRKRSKSKKAKRSESPAHSASGAAAASPAASAVVDAPSEAPQPVDYNGNPIERVRQYLQVADMFSCGLCSAKIWNTSRFCAWCQAKVYLECDACNEKTRVPNSACVHCKAEFPPEEPPDLEMLPMHMVPLATSGPAPPLHDANGQIAHKTIVYFPTEEMLNCGHCYVQIMPHSNYCHWCAARVFLQCSACNELSRSPTGHCIHCGESMGAGPEPIASPLALPARGSPATPLPPAAAGTSPFGDSFTFPARSPSLTGSTRPAASPLAPRPVNPAYLSPGRRVSNSSFPPPMSPMSCMTDDTAASPMGLSAPSPVTFGRPGR
ncbi:hypothetical protein DIPPA_08415 [Diplonema papillatum]|nr:hypothetical protein DIPPA_08415 [Diplonema papillatum]